MPSIPSFTPNKGYASFSSLVFPKITPTSLAAGAQTLTAAAILGGLLITSASGSTDTLTLPTAALLNAAIEGVEVGTSFEFTLRNGDPADTVTVAVGTGGTASGTMTIATANSKRFLVRVTGVRSDSVVGSADSYTIYSLGTSTF